MRVGRFRVPPTGFEGRQAVRGPGAVAVGIVNILLPRRRKGPAHRGTDRMDRAQGIDPNLTMEGDAARRGGGRALHRHPMRRDLHGHFTGDPVWFPVGCFAPVKGGPKEGATGPTGDAGIEPKSPRRGRSRFHVVRAGRRIPKARSLDLGNSIRAAVRDWGREFLKIAPCHEIGYRWGVRASCEQPVVKPRCPRSRAPACRG